MPDAADIRLIVFDVDGVLTDGSVLVNDHGIETKRFHVRDGLAMSAAKHEGLKVGVLSSRASRAVTLRMIELGVELVMQGARNKLIGLETLCQRAGVMPEDAAFVGDDLLDMPALLRSGYPIAVNDAAKQVREVAVHVTASPGGRGAARDAIEHLLQAQGRWDRIVERYSL